jgi:hypothetical protein
MSRFKFVVLAGMTLGAPVTAADVPVPTKIAPQTETINKLIAAKWAEAGIDKPAERAKDSEFLRRAFIDLIGRIPTSAEVVDFEADSSLNKRQKLIHRLLYTDDPKSPYKPLAGSAVKFADDQDNRGYVYSSEYAAHWANLWTVWLMSRSAHSDYRTKINNWLEGQLDNNLNYRDFVTQLLTATGSNAENGAVNFVMYHLGDANPQDKQSSAGPFDAVPVTARVTRLFLGLQTQCTQCHDHPFNKEWSQSDYWGVNAFFRQTTRSGNLVNPNDRQMAANPPPLTVRDVNTFNSDGVVFYERRDGKVMAAKPEFLKDIAQADKGEKSGKLLDTDGKKSRREQLADFVVKHDNFSKAYVNRIWGHLFGRGLNKEATVDDFGSNNEVIHPELLEHLGKSFAAYQYDPKQLLYWICTSDAYGLSHVGNKKYTDPKYDAYFARMPLKAMSPEVLYDSLLTATKVDQNADRDARKTRRERWEAKLVRTFGDDEGNEMTFNGTIIQALLMMNGRELNDEIARPEATNPILKIVMKHGGKKGAVRGNEVIEELFLATVSRRPTSQELQGILAIRNSGAKVDLGTASPPKSATTIPPKSTTSPPAKGPAGKGPNKTPVTATGVVPPTNANDTSFYLDVLWALINTNEFMLNH